MTEFEQTVVKVKIESGQVAPVAEDLLNDPNKSLDVLTRMIMLRREGELLGKSKAGIEELQEKHKRIATINATSQKVNICESGALDLTKNPDLLDSLRKAKEAGVDINLEKMKYTVEERNRLLENLGYARSSLELQASSDTQTANLLPQIFESWGFANRVLQAYQNALMAPTKKLV